MFNDSLIKILPINPLIKPIYSVRLSHCRRLNAHQGLSKSCRKAVSTSSKIWVQIIDLQTAIPGENYFRDLGYTKQDKHSRIRFHSKSFFLLSQPNVWARFSGHQPHCDQKEDEGLICCFKLRKVPIIISEITQQTKFSHYTTYKSTLHEI